MDEKLKKEVETSLVTSILNALEDHKITLVDMRTMSNYILDNILPVTDTSQLLAFLDGLKTKWMMFDDVYKIYKNKLIQEKERMVMDKLTNYIKKSKLN